MVCELADDMARVALSPLQGDCARRLQVCMRVRVRECVRGRDDEMVRDGAVSGALSPPLRFPLSRALSSSSRAAELRSRAPTAVRATPLSPLGTAAADQPTPIDRPRNRYCTQIPLPYLARHRGGGGGRPRKQGRRLAHMPSRTVFGVSPRALDRSVAHGNTTQTQPNRR